MNIQSLLLDTIHHMNEAIALADINENDLPLIFVNAAFTRMTGYESEEILGRNCRFLQGPQTNLQTIDAMSKCIRDRSAGVFEIYNYRKDQTGFWNRVSLAPIYRDKQLICYAAIQSDVTLQHASRDAIEEHHKRLMQMMSFVSGDIKERVKQVSQEMQAHPEQVDSLKAVLHQLSLLVTMLETDSTEIMQLVRDN